MSNPKPTSTLPIRLRLHIITRPNSPHAPPTKQNKPICYSVQHEKFNLFPFSSQDFFENVMRDYFVKFGFCSVWFSCLPSFNLLLCLELVKQFSVVGGSGWWRWMLKATLVFIFDLKTRTMLQPRPKLNNSQASYLGDNAWRQPDVRLTSDCLRNYTVKKITAAPDVYPNIAGSVTGYSWINIHTELPAISSFIRKYRL